MARLCKNCSGSGRSKCPRCDGHGTMESKKTCYYCNGERAVDCPACDGTGKIEEQQTTNLAKLGVNLWHKVIVAQTVGIAIRITTAKSKKKQ